MSSYLLFLLLGLGSGAVYAILGLGLVLKYRSAGVVDFSHGAVAMFCAYVYIELRSSGELQFPWIIIPHQVRIASTKGMDTVPAILITLVYAAILGLIFYRLVYRPLRNAPPLARVGASIGVLLTLEAIAVLNYSTFAVSSPPILPDTPIHLGGLFVPSDRLYLTGLTIVVGIILAAVYRFTRFGLVTRAAVENERGAALLGHSATRIAAWNWVLATVLAAAAGILILPITTLNPGTYTLFIVPALGAALLGRFSSFSVVVAAGLGIGMLQSELIKLSTVWTWLPQPGSQVGLPFVIIVIAMVVLTRRLRARGDIGAIKNPMVGRPRAPARTAGAAVVIGIVALLLSSADYRSAIDSSLIVACVCFSIVVITGYLGQISLVQNGMAGISAFMLVHIEHGLGIGFPLGVILAALCAVVVGVVVGLPAVRVRGVGHAGRHRVSEHVVQRWLHRPDREEPAPARTQPRHHRCRQRHEPDRLRGDGRDRRRSGRTVRGPSAQRTPGPRVPRRALQRARSGLDRHRRDPHQAVRVRPVGVHRRNRRLPARLPGSEHQLRLVYDVHLVGDPRHRLCRRGRADHRRARRRSAARLKRPRADAPEQPVQLRPIPGADRRGRAHPDRGQEPRRHHQGDGRRIDEAAPGGDAAVGALPHARG
jgi:branched-subunit amino acid ABC-type transport system permease component